jgi:hypothetical protein
VAFMQPYNGYSMLASKDLAAGKFVIIVQSRLFGLKRAFLE